MYLPVPPVCKPKGVKVYGVAKMETAHIACNVEANPPEVSFRSVSTKKKLNDLSLLKSAVFFRWTFNNSAEAKTVSERFIRTNGSTSLLTFTPTRTLEYGTLMCWSRNSVGEQRDPCIFHIIAAGNFQNYISQTFLCGFPYWSQIIFKYLKTLLMLKIF